MELGFSVGNGCPLWFWSESLPKVECFKPFRFLFMSESRRWWRESIKVKLLIYRSIYIPNLIYSNELWVVTDGMRVQMVEMSFLWRVSGLSLRLRTLIIWESNSHYIPPHQKKVVWLSGEEVSWKAPRWSGFLGGCSTERRARICWRNDVEHLSGPPKQLEEGSVGVCPYTAAPAAWIENGLEGLQLWLIQNCTFY